MDEVRVMDGARAAEEVHGPATELETAEFPDEGRVVLTFSARPGPAGTPVAFTEYRLGDGRWRRGDRVEVRRRGVVSRVAFRSVDAAGAVGPEKTWERNWPGLRVVEHPPGSSNWLATCEWWRFRSHDRWWLDQPVSLIFRCPAAGMVDAAGPALVPRVERALRRAGLRSWIFDLVQAFGRGSVGGLAVGVGGPPDPFAPTTRTKGLKRRLDAANLQSSLHVRVYAPAQRSFRDEEYGSWAAGTCHLDVNELMRAQGERVRWAARLPGGAPDPGVGADYLKYTGDSLRATELVVERWRRAFGFRAVSRESVWFGAPQDWFREARRGTHRGRIWVIGTWWRSDGRATVLTVPDWV